ncbi:hypothetical protein C8R45DRAFT_921124 [Mycena sanguinolenta]|nr:hypothetical protein C8R45DRAFT_921124 [Mycena sanguinolenta]
MPLYISLLATDSPEEQRSRLFGQRKRSLFVPLFLIGVEDAGLENDRCAHWKVTEVEMLLGPGSPRSSPGNPRSDTIQCPSVQKAAAIVANASFRLSWYPTYRRISITIALREPGKDGYSVITQSHSKVARTKDTTLVVSGPRIEANVVALEQLAEVARGCSRTHACPFDVKTFQLHRSRLHELFAERLRRMRRPNPTGLTWTPRFSWAIAADKDDAIKTAGEA